MIIKKSKVTLCLLIVILSISVAGIKYQNLKPQYIIETPKTSDGEITIFTPENKTYTESMKGYYPGTYGFEEDAIGNSGTEISLLNRYISNSGSAHITNVDEINGHKNVLQMYDGTASANQNFYAYHDFDTNIESGTIELWVMGTSFSAADKTGAIYYFGNTSGATYGDFSSLFGFHIDNNNDGLVNFNGNDWAGLYSDDTWHHIRVDFESTPGGYLGLDQYKLNFWFDEEKLLENSPFLYNASLGMICTASHGYDNTRHDYLDALGFSLDLDYSIGDNLEEGLLLSYENTTTLDWQGYSLDGVANKTILGNTTISLPNNGAHNIQVFGNDTMGSNFESDLMYFSVDIPPISIITPENITYTAPMSGYYPGTYGFEGDAIGNSGTEISLINRYESDSSSAYITTVDEMNGHKNVLQLYDGTASANQNFYANHDFDTNIESGTIEFWALSTAYGGDQMGIYYNFGNESGSEYTGTYSLFIIRIDTNNDGLVNFNGNEWAGLYSDDTWHHIRVDFESTPGGYLGLDQYKLSFWFDETKLLDNEPMLINDSLGTILAHSHGYDNTRHDYLDALGFSWDPGYSIGDNLEEGLLLSYENTTTLDWQGYSLDGAANKTILGNTTIPMPSDGPHNIQVYGNDSMGVMYNSDIRFFEVNTIAPIITINTPLSNQFFGFVPPSFDLTISDPNPTNRWYSLDGGTTNVTFTGLAETIDQTEWDKIGNGVVTINFYVNDTSNFIGQAEVIVRKDIVAPVVSIIFPTTAQEFENPPIFDITIDEVNLDAYWYTIDNGVHNYTITSLTGIIDQGAWDIASNGPITILFYARDDVGNIGMDIVIVTKITSNPQPGIPGYDLLLLLGVSSLITIILIKRKFKK